jgi:hypothetical protein
VGTFADRMAAAGDRLAARGARLARTGAVRSAWRLGASLVAGPLLLLSVVQVTGLIAHEEETLVREYGAAEVAALDIDNDAGSTRVVGIEGRAAVTVRSRVSEGLQAPRHEVSTVGDLLLVRASCPLFGTTWCRVDLTVEVPADMPVDVDGRGSVRLTGLTGAVTVSVRQGSVELEHIGGPVDVSAHQGSVRGTGLVAERVQARAHQGSVELEFATAPRAIVARARQGSIEILLPDEPGVAYAMQTQADQGSLTNLVDTDQSSDRSIAADVSHGSILIAYAPS